MWENKDEKKIHKMKKIRSRKGGKQDFVHSSNLSRKSSGTHLR